MTDRPVHTDPPTHPVAVPDPVLTADPAAVTCPLCRRENRPTSTPPANRPTTLL